MISQADIQSLKDYVKGPSSQNQADSIVRLQVTHSNLKAHFMELRLDLHVSSCKANMPVLHSSHYHYKRCADDNLCNQAEAHESYWQQP